MELIFRNPKLYFLSGKAGSGKSLVAAFFKEEYAKLDKKAVVISYARHLKFYAKEYFGWDGMEETKPRDLLNEIGTTLVRGQLQKNRFIINRLMEDTEILSYYFDVIIVDDARFEDELDIPRTIHPNLIAIRIKRDNFDSGLTEEQKNSVTETNLDNYDKFNYVIMGTKKELQEKVIDIIQQEEK